MERLTSKYMRDESCNVCDGRKTDRFVTGAHDVDLVVLVRSKQASAMSDNQTLQLTLRVRQSGDQGTVR